MARFWTTRTRGAHRGRSEPLLSDPVFHVRVCGFTFTFHSLVEIQQYLDFYSQRIHPSSRLPVFAVGYGDHGETQSAFMRLPLRLQREANRRKVAAALREARERFCTPRRTMTS